jgi:hypothetical protein
MLHTEIEIKYIELLETRTEMLVKHAGNLEAIHEDDEWRMHTSVLAAKIENFKSSFPADPNNPDDENLRLHNLFDSYIESLYDPVISQAAYDDFILENARTNIIDVLSMSLTPPNDRGYYDLSIRLKNNSNVETISQVHIIVSFFDERGNPAPQPGRLDSDGNLSHHWLGRTAYLVPGQEKPFLFSIEWGNPNVARTEMSMQVFFTQGGDYYIRPEIFAAIWG